MDRPIQLTDAPPKMRVAFGIHQGRPEMIVGDLVFPLTPEQCDELSTKLREMALQARNGGPLT